MDSRVFFTALMSLMVLSVPPATVADDDESVAALHQIFDEAWERDLRFSPTFASSLGDRRYNDQWNEVSVASQQRQHESDREILSMLGDIERSTLPPGEQLNYDLFRDTYENRETAFAFNMYLIPLNQRGGVQNANELTERLRFTSVKDYEDWLARIESIAALVDQNIAVMTVGMDENVMPPQITMSRVPDQIKAQVVEAPEDSPFYAPFADFPEDFASAVRERLSQEALTAIKEAVIPAYERFYEFFTEIYLPACRGTVGAWDFPDGEAFYAFRVRRYTTTELTPDEIHDIGVKEVRRIREEMDKVIEQVEFEGTFQEFLHFMRTDPQFYFDNPDDLHQEYLATSKRIDPELVKLFGVLPRMPYGIRPIPDAIAPDTTTAYYSRPAADGSRAGYYYVNLYKPEVRPKYEIEVLTVHEAMPGHHLQIALSQELGDLPNFRRFGGYTAFVEGWGLYSESLGGDLGLYKDPYSRFGQLTYEMWRAVRLVVDTGMHHKRWSRQQSIDFFKDNAAKTEHDIINEIDRYISWPGQALAYKIGELKIKQLRRKAEEQLGENFDIRKFHDTVLGSGAVPLNILEDNVMRMIEERLKTED